MMLHSIALALAQPDKIFQTKYSTVPHITLECLAHLNQRNSKVECKKDQPTMHYYQKQSGDEMYKSSEDHMIPRQ